MVVHKRLINDQWSLREVKIFANKRSSNHQHLPLAQYDIQIDLKSTKMVPRSVPGQKSVRAGGARGVPRQGFSSKVDATWLISVALWGSSWALRVPQINYLKPL